VAQYLGKSILGKNALDIEHCSIIMDKTIFANTSIKSAFDIALYDIASQQAALPLYQFLSGTNSKKIITDYTVSIGEASKMANDAQKIIDNGFQFIKVKLGGTKENDIERIQLIRAKIGMDTPIRIDANQGWSVDDAIEILNELAQYNIQHCEEPIARWNFMEAHKVKEQSPIPIMADESCLDHHDAKRLIDLGACDMFNLKLGKSSGIFKAEKIIALAQQSNMTLQFGGFLESRLAFTAAAHLALTSDNIIHFDFDTPLMFVEDPVIGGIEFDNKGVISVPETIGLGATVDESYLKKQTSIVVN
jgi:L-alanine-DL-glutamate epimerase-like enolase superfamily enzyme